MAEWRVTSNVNNPYLLWTRCDLLAQFCLFHLLALTKHLLALTKQDRQFKRIEILCNTFLYCMDIISHFSV
jgi:hypothetical protein